LVVFKTTDTVVGLGGEAEERELEMFGKLLERGCRQVGDEQVRIVPVGTRFVIRRQTTSFRSFVYVFSGHFVTLSTAYLK